MSLKGQYSEQYGYCTQKKRPESFPNRTEISSSKVKDNGVVFYQAFPFFSQNICMDPNVRKTSNAILIYMCMQKLMATRVGIFSLT